MSNKLLAWVFGVGIIIFLAFQFRSGFTSAQMAAAGDLQKIPQGAVETVETIDPTATGTPLLTATIGYQATAIAAQSAASTAQADADAERRLLVSATMTHEANLQEMARWTATADEYNRQSAQSTQQSAPTYVPMTATQSQINSLMMATNQGIYMTAQSMTQQAPTQLVAMAIAQAQAANADLNEKVSIIGPFAALIALIILGAAVALAFIRRQRSPVPANGQPDDEAARTFQQFAGTPILIRNEDNTFAGRVVIPCTEFQLDVLADGVINQGLSLTFRNWTGAGKPFTRDTSWPIMRRFLIDEKLVYETERGELALTSNGEVNGVAFLRGWMEGRTLPRRYVMTNDSGIISGENTHMRAPHECADGGGGALKPLLSRN